MKLYVGNRLAGLLLPASLLSFTPAIGQDESGPSQIAMLSGECQYVAISGNNFSKFCQGSIVQSVYENEPRTGFTVVIGAGDDVNAIITFSGLEAVKPDADSQLQTVDKVILNLGMEDVEPAVTVVKGSCAYTNPTKGPATISCHAFDDDKSSYILHFRTDGSPPKFMFED